MQICLQHFSQILGQVYIFYVVEVGFNFSMNSKNEGMYLIICDNFKRSKIFFNISSGITYVCISQKG